MSEAPEAPAKKPLGRPSVFTQELADAICAAIVDSDYGIEQISERDEFPAKRTIFRWLTTNEAFRHQYAQAKEAQGHVQADRGLRDALNATDAQLGRLKFDARKWAASKLAPKQYGDKVAHVGGSETDEPIKTALTVSFV